MRLRRRQSKQTARYYGVACEHCKHIFVTQEPLWPIVWKIECPWCLEHTPFRGPEVRWAPVRQAWVALDIE